MASDDSFGLTAALRRTVIWVVSLAVVGILIGAIYLRFTTKRHVAVATVVIERMEAPGGNSTGADSLDAVLDAQAEILRSSDVVRLADANANFALLRSFASGPDRDPVRAIRRDLQIERPAGTSKLLVSYASPEPLDAQRVVDEVVRAYQAYQSDQRTRKSREMASAIESQRRDALDRLGAARRVLADFDAGRNAGEANLVAPATQQVESMARAATDAQLETFAARRAYDDAVANAGATLSGLNDQQLEEALAQAGANAPDSSDLINQEAAALAQQLTELRRTYAANHPAVARATARLKQIRLVQVASARQRWKAAQTREADIRLALDELQTRTTGRTARESERERLAAEVASLQTQAEEIERQYAQVSLATMAGTLNIHASDAIVDHEDYPAVPRTAPTLATAGLIGLVAGGLLALLGEYRTAGTLRHVVPAALDRDTAAATPSAERATRTVGVPVVGAIPDADEAADEIAGDVRIGQASHADPFGPIANAVRAMRRRLDIEGKLPATIVLTAAAPGQGVSVLAANLAATIAREGRKVLLVDAYFANPAVAAEWSVSSDRGLTELVAGGDPLELIQTTSVPRLDALPTGSVPADSAALFNDDQFLRLITALTSAYDHVVFDAAPLSAGDDARIIASACDATVLVSRPGTAWLRRAAGGRDLLLTVGANLLGVALNRVASDGERRPDRDRTEGAAAAAPPSGERDAE